MSLTLVHAFVSAKSDGSDATLVQPSNWNAAHKLAGATTGDILVATNTTTLGAITAAQGVLVCAGAGTIASFSMSPSLTSLTLATALTPANGGIGALTNFAVGDLLYASGTATLAKLADVAIGSVLVSGGVGAAPAWSATPTLTSVTTTDLYGGGSTASFPRWKRNATAWDARLADDSAYAGINVAAITSTSLAIGTNPASAGAVRLPNDTGGAIVIRNTANTADFQVLYVDTSDRLIVGGAGGGSLSAIVFRMNGTTYGSIGQGGGGTISLGNTGAIQFNGSSNWNNIADGQWQLTNHANDNTWSRLILGPNSSSGLSIANKGSSFFALRNGNDSGVAGAATASLPSASSSNDGLITFDTTLNAFIYYVGGNRYKLAGTSF